MSSYTPKTDLWIERSRLAGIIIGAVSYGVYFLLTVQSSIALVRRPRHGAQIANHRLALLFYIFITFALGTISFAANAKYTEMIWIDLRDAPGGPLTLIQNEMAYRINVLALSSGHVQEWFMSALLLYRCFVIWNWLKWVMIPMTTLYIVMIALSVLIQVEASSGVVFYSIGTELAYLCVQVGFTVIYTVLVAHRLLNMRSQMKQAVAHYDSSLYDTVVLMLIESAMFYSMFAITFIVAFALHLNGITTLCFLSVGQVQGIAQLFIIIRVATGRAYTNEWSTRVAAAPTTVVFSGIASDTTEEPTDEEIARPEQNVVRRHSTSEKAAEVDVCIA
ncbi:hypothetical protein DEU56DRAFT_914644 [Suillus clintonianus]|uniref:uncharacterized protein n=1 Tax=Suillus clintonianus TaxID=1904413 RepID=UPI001B87C20D|nr:uncharacterized protein DEU56DRAFT_914644 [Suillus clintonianus]KAG2130881.1 hypothetical protein DEU56DRAFT_914644 [Suillus clintonianus]